MATETTLVEELESAAAALHAYASWLGSQGSGDGMRDMVADAARLRARAERVREAMEQPRFLRREWDEEAKCHTIRLVDIDALCGPLGAATREGSSGAESPSEMKGRSR